MPEYGLNRHELKPLIGDDNFTDKENVNNYTDRLKKKSILLKSQLKGYPKCVGFILGNEFCERYSYYGMRTILVLYLNSYLLFDEDTSTAIYHAFTVLAYLFPLFGAIIADSWWGKYKTILWLSLVYCIGMVMNVLGTIPSMGTLEVHIALSCAGLFVIAVGTGGIKPCVSSFGGDQFELDQSTLVILIAAANCPLPRSIPIYMIPTGLTFDIEKYRRSFFSLFYFAINAGSLVSTFVSPIIRDEVVCFEEQCYALAFGIPAVLMIIAVLLFLFGTRWYKVIPPQGNIFLRVTKAIGCAVKERWNTPSKQRTKEHWLDYAEAEHGRRLIKEIKYVLRILILYIPLPVFWALFDQQGSRWTLQAVRMNGYVGSIRILPDQMQICNPLIIVTLIPIFEVTLYPCLDKFKINFSPLRRMSAGMLLAGISFVVAGLVQLMIDENLTIVPDAESQSSLRIINSADCNMYFNSKIYPQWEDTVETSGGEYPNVLYPGNATESKEWLIQPVSDIINYGCENVDNNFEYQMVGDHAMDFIISNGLHGLKTYRGFHTTKKSDSGNGIISIFNALNENITIQLQDAINNGPVELSFNSIVKDFNVKERGTFEMKVTLSSGEVTMVKYNVDTGGIYTMVLRSNVISESISPDDLLTDEYTDVYYSDISIFWMIPQFFIITLGEVFLSVTGLEFSYSQAPISMKSVLSSFWLLTVSIGNIIVLIIAEAKFVPNQADEYFLFAGLIGAALIAFIFLAVRYKYVDENEFSGADDEDEQSSLSHSEEKKELDEDSSSGKDNEGFDHETGF